MSKYIVAITGASGVIYGINLVKELLDKEHEIHFVASEPAILVIQHELNWDFEESIEKTFNSFFSSDNFYLYKNSDISAKIASGSFITDGMIIIPSSMSTISSVAMGMSNNLIERAADVMLKEKRDLIVVPRETPFSAIHLKNLLALSELGVQIIPAMPAFYNQPTSIEDMVNFIVGKVLDVLKEPNDIFARYEGI
ncbi:Flavin prenyltransferase UbiX [Candidatus Syntrophocurvum alkaliphilum]|uniref:Flavin prenyltransferase UbiX n=1 Tax=Candidatus Syntrophocurvum alkaliphilum TaxID=2293317 RepID=A0A6I6DCL2_9FIRM|nr:flavin prenyltransferase UbiX [Candidatus Syntrophocurvum alkaliphilum]QGT99045.1 Flavin prenyltransferase UbiX [Candidatus Syntrophocurvum alkaliphilum]